MAVTSPELKASSGSSTSERPPRPGGAPTCPGLHAPPESSDPPGPRANLPATANLPNKRNAEYSERAALQVQGGPMGRV